MSPRAGSSNRRRHRARREDRSGAAPLQRGAAAQNSKTVVARVLTSLYPHVYLGQNQVAFLDHGSEDGLRPGKSFGRAPTR
jgi:hypothetical protein